MTLTPIKVDETQPVDFNEGAPDSEVDAAKANLASMSATQRAYVDKVAEEADALIASLNPSSADRSGTKAFDPELHPRAADGEFGEGAGHDIEKVVDEAGADADSDSDATLTSKQKYIATAISALNDQPDADSAVWDATRTSIAKLSRVDYQERTKASRNGPSHPRIDPTGGKADPDQMLADASTPDGGFTWNPNTGQTASFGFAVAVGSREKVVDSPLTMDVVRQYIKDNSDAVDLTKKGNYVGAWNNPENGKIYLDVSTVTTNAERARRLCGDTEISFFDLQTFKSVTVNPGKVG
jgi:hypothetical protein